MCAEWHYGVLQYSGMQFATALAVLPSLLVDVLNTDVWGLHDLLKANASRQQCKLQYSEHLPYFWRWNTGKIAVYTSSELLCCPASMLAGQLYTVVWCMCRLRGLSCRQMQRCGQQGPRSLSGGSAMLRTGSSRPMLSQPACVSSSR